MDNGWIKLHRRMSTWEWYSDSKTLHVFIDLLIHANHVDGRWRGIDVLRGQLVTSLKKIAERTGITEMSARTCLKRLEKSGEITRKSTNKFTLITICNYDAYQTQNSATNKQLTNKQQTNNKQITNKQQTTNKQLTTNKKEKKEKKEKERKEKEGKSNCPQQKIIKMYNDVAGDKLRNVIPSLWSDKRAQVLRRRWEEDASRQNLDWWQWYFEKIVATPFLTGDNNRGWTADIDWMLKGANMAKVLEGKYGEARQSAKKINNNPCWKCAKHLEIDSPAKCKVSGYNTCADFVPAKEEAKA